MNAERNIRFNDVTYNQAAIANMSDADLLKLRNLVAANLGVSAIKSFKDNAAAQEGAWNALVKWADADPEDEKPVKPVKAKAEPKPYEVPTKALPGTIKRPTIGMFATIKKLVDGAEKGGARWANYKDGMTIADIIEGNDMCRPDIMFYVDNQMMEVVDATPEQFAERKAAWYKKHGQTDPEVAKAEAKSAKEKERLEKKAAADKVKADKAEAAAKAKADREAAAAQKKAAADKDKADKAEAAAKAKATADAKAAEAAKG